MKVLSKKQIFSNYKTYELEDDLTIGEILNHLEFPDEIKSYVDVRINGYKIYPHTWDKCRPNPESVVTVAILPAGGSDNNQLISTIATVAIAYSAAGFAGGTFAKGTFGSTFFASSFNQGVFVAGATLVGSQLANAMFPPPEPPKINGFGVSRLPTVTGQSNRADQYGPVIRNYGRNRVYPRVVAEPFVFYVGNDQYLSAVYDFGIGDNDIQIGKLKIGETSLNDYSGFTYNFAKKPSDFVIYTNSTSIESFSLPFNNENDNY